MYIHKSVTAPSTYPATVRFKKLTLFFLASSALISSGFLLGDHLNFNVLFLLIYCNLTGLFLIYRLNDCIDQSAGLSLNINHFFQHQLHKIMVLQFVVLLIPLAFIWLPNFSFMVLGIAALVGMFYSLSFTINGKQFRLKNVFILKNVLIGLAWGGLVIVGSGTLEAANIIGLFSFTSIQVMIGSIIRDVPDLDKDRLNNVRTFPVVIGLHKTFFVMQGLNLLSVLTLYLFSENLWIFTISTIVIWRMMNIILLRLSPLSKLWSQGVNLFTCILIFLATFVAYYASNS